MSMTSFFGRSIVLAFAVCGAFVPMSMAQEFNLAVGKHEAVQSKILGEKRDILVSAPHEPKPNMPLLIVLDGEWNFA
jgi:hypothetical protein